MLGIIFSTNKGKLHWLQFNKGKGVSNLCIEIKKDAAC